MADIPLANTVPTWAFATVPAYALQTGAAAVSREPPFAPGDEVPYCPLDGSEGNGTCNATVAYDPNTPVIACTALPAEFLSCTLYDYSEMTDTEYAGLPPEALAAGCRQWTNTPGTQPGTTSALCRVAPNVSCAGDRLYYVDNVPCIKYGGYSYLTVLLLSLFLGVLGVDRLCLQWNCMGAAKLLTLGGIGVWWLVDLILLTTGQMVPADGSLWNPSW